MGAAAGMGSHGVAALMIVFGAGGFLAGRTIGRVLQSVPIKRVLIVVLSTMTVLLGILAWLTAIEVHPLAAIVLFPLLFALGGAWWSGGISQQTRIAGHAPAQRSQAIGLHFSAQFLGVAVGGALGGLALDNSGPVAVPVVSALIAAATILSVRMVAPVAGSGAPGAADARHTAFAPS